jgi:hypothetical protein
MCTTLSYLDFIIFCMLFGKEMVCWIRIGSRSLIVIQEENIHDVYYFFELRWYGS